MDTAEMSPEIHELAKSLAGAQSEIQAATKGKVNPHFNSRYADLASVWEAVRAPLTKYGLSVVQLPLSDGDRVGVSTTLLHQSGQWIRGTLWGRPDKPGPQALVSCVTYFRRTALAAVAGVAPDDDDGNAASPGPNTWGPPRGEAEGKAAAPSAPQGARSATTTSRSSAPKANQIKHDGTFATPEQVKVIHVLKAKVGGLSDDKYRTQLAVFRDCDGKPITTSKDLSEAQASFLIDRYEKKIAEQAGRAAQGFDTTPPLKAAASAVDQIRKAMERGPLNEQELCAYFNVDGLAELPQEQQGTALALVLHQGTARFVDILEELQAATR